METRFAETIVISKDENVVQAEHELLRMAAERKNVLEYGEVND